MTHSPRLVATFPGGWNGAGGMVFWFNLSLHRQAADWYAQSWFQEHGSWPTGKNEFNVTYGLGPHFNVQKPLGTSSGNRTVSMYFDILNVENQLHAEQHNSGSLLSYMVRISKE